MKVFATLLVIAAVIFGGITFLSRDANAGPQEIALIGPNHASVTLIVEVADDPEERSQGLMFRESLAPDHGMLFLFPVDSPEVLSFWMKNTLIPLDIIFFDAQGKVLSWTTMEPCEADPCQRYASGVPATYALEVNAGFVGEYGINEDWNIALPERN